MKDELKALAEAVWDAGANYASQFQPGEGLVSVPGDPQPDWDGQRAKDVAALTEAVQGYVSERDEWHDAYNAMAADYHALVEKFNVARKERDEARAEIARLKEETTAAFEAMTKNVEDGARRLVQAEQREQALRDGLREKVIAAWKAGGASSLPMLLEHLDALLTAPAAPSEDERDRLEAARARAFALHIPNADAIHPPVAPAGPQEQESGWIEDPSGSGSLIKVDPPKPTKAATPGQEPKV